MVTIEEMIVFVQEQTSAEEVKPESEIGNDLGVDGDDFDDLMIAYQKKYGVNLDEFRWYFHYAEEGSWNSIGASFFKAPHQRVTHIPVTPQLLLEMANKGKWDFPYPQHKLPKRRYDILLNQILFFLFTIYIIYRCAS